MTEGVNTLQKGVIEKGVRVNVPNLFITEAEELDLSEDVELERPAFLHANDGGTVVVDLYDGGEEITFTVDDGGYLFAHCTKVYATSTATGVVACRG